MKGTLPWLLRVPRNNYIRTQVHHSRSLEKIHIPLKIVGNRRYEMEIASWTCAIVVFLTLGQFGVNAATYSAFDITTYSPYSTQRYCGQACLDRVYNVACQYPYPKDCVCRPGNSESGLAYLSSCISSRGCSGDDGDINAAQTVFNDYCTAQDTILKPTDASNSLNPSRTPTTGATRTNTQATVTVTAIISSSTRITATSTSELLLLLLGTALSLACTIHHCCL